MTSFTKAADGPPGYKVADAPISAIRQLWKWCTTKLEQRPFLRNVSLMLTGASSGQLISILLSPVLTRLYSPQQFGVLSVYLAVLSILVVVASLRYELTLPIAATDSDAMNLAAICVCGLIVTTAAVSVGAVLFPKDILESLWPTPLSAFNLMSYRALMPAGFLCLGGYYIALYMATRVGAYRSIALSRLNQGLVGPLTQIGLATTGAGAPGLLIGSILGQSAGTFGLLRRVVEAQPELLKMISWRRMAILANRYKRFPLIASWTAVLDAAGGNQLLYLLVSTQYSPEIAGFIFLVERVVARPLSMIGTSILQVFVGEAGRTISGDPKGLKRRFRQIITHQFWIAVVWIAVANVAAARFLPMVFGSEWSEAVIYLQAMSIGYLAQAVVLPVFHTLQILERQVTAALWQITRVSLTLAVFKLGTYYDVRPPLVIFGYSIGQAVMGLILLGLMTRAIQKLQVKEQ